MPLPKILALGYIPAYPVRVDGKSGAAMFIRCVDEETEFFVVDAETNKGTWHDCHGVTFMRAASTGPLGQLDDALRHAVEPA